MDLKMAFRIKEMTLALSNIQINETTSQKTIKHTQTEKSNPTNEKENRTWYRDFKDMS